MTIIGANHRWLCAGGVGGFLIASELICLLLTPGALGFNYCLRSHMQMNLPSFLVPVDSSPDYQALPLCSKTGRKQLKCQRPGGPPGCADRQSRMKVPAAPRSGSGEAEEFKVVSGESLLL